MVALKKNPSTPFVELTNLDGGANLVHMNTCTKHDSHEAGTRRSLVQPCWAGTQNHIQEDPS
jgi:hypothetical protein